MSDRRHWDAEVSRGPNDYRGGERLLVGGSLPERAPGGHAGLAAGVVRAATAPAAAPVVVPRWSTDAKLVRAPSTNPLPVSEIPTREVFVDEQGRRARWAGWAGRAFAGAAMLYLIMMVASMVGAPWVPRLSITGLGPALPPGRQLATLGLPPSATRIPAPVLDKAPARRDTVRAAHAAGAASPTGQAVTSSPAGRSTPPGAGIPPGATTLLPARGQGPGKGQGSAGGTGSAGNAGNGGNSGNAGGTGTTTGSGPSSPPTTVGSGSTSPPTTMPVRATPVLGNGHAVGLGASTSPPGYAVTAPGRTKH